MEGEITSDEIKELKAALISAFPSAGALEQMVAFNLDEQLNVIAGGSNYSEIVFELIQWAKANDKTETLINGARKENPGNSKLCKFEEQYRLRRRKVKPTSVPQVHLPPQLRLTLIETLVTICAGMTYQGRSTLLGSIPGGHLLTRSETSVYDDIVGIIDQLDQRGRLSSGTWPLLMLIDNMLLQVEGYAVGDTLQTIRQTLAQQYKG